MGQRDESVNPPVQVSIMPTEIVLAIALITSNYIVKQPTEEQFITDSEIHILGGGDLDTSDLVIDYTTQDFEQAIRHLLPKGPYWREETNTELTGVIKGMATDFKVMHDEIQLALLSDFSESLFGWKIAEVKVPLTILKRCGWLPCPQRCHCFVWPT